jgi:dTDP-glucose pyrophosphorylase
MAAGLGSRFGGTKQLAEVGPSGEAVLDYTIADARAAGFGPVVLIVRRDLTDPVASHLARFHADAADFTLVCQDLEPTAPPRAKPWGTGHAVLSAAGHVQGPFAVVNADDFYGREAIAALARSLREEGGPGRFHLVGYRLAATLSPRGTVSRGVCAVDGDGRLTSIREHTAIARGGDGAIRSGGFDGPILADDTLVSMNLWGLHASLFGPLAEGFGRFVAEHGEEGGAEFLLPEVIAGELASGAATVTVQATSTEWLGVTYPGDLDDVTLRIGRLVAGGAYPTPLSTGARQRHTVVGRSA